MQFIRAITLCAICESVIQLGMPLELAMQHDVILSSIATIATPSTTTAAATLWPSAATALISIEQASKQCVALRFCALHDDTRQQSDHQASSDSVVERWYVKNLGASTSGVYQRIMVQALDAPTKAIQATFGCTEMQHAEDLSSGQLSSVFTVGTVQPSNGNSNNASYDSNASDGDSSTNNYWNSKDLEELFNRASVTSIEPQSDIKAYVVTHAFSAAMPICEATTACTAEATAAAAAAEATTAAEAPTAAEAVVDATSPIRTTTNNIAPSARAESQAPRSTQALGYYLTTNSLRPGVREEMEKCLHKEQSQIFVVSSMREETILPLAYHAHVVSHRHFLVRCLGSSDAQSMSQFAEVIESVVHCYTPELDDTRVQSMHNSNNNDNGDNNTTTTTATATNKSKPEPPMTPSVAMLISGARFEHASTFEPAALARVLNQCHAIVGCEFNASQRAKAASYLRNYMGQTVVMVAAAVNNILAMKQASIAVALTDPVVYGMANSMHAKYTITDMSQLYNILCHEKDVQARAGCFMC
jgi:hypothetical protein